MEPRFEKNALTVRFGGSTKQSPSKVEVYLGRFSNWAQSALVIAALVCAFL